MEMSAEKGELFAALAKFQGELSNAYKGKSGHGYKYADLAQCIDSAKVPLSNNGLAVSQMLGMSPEGKQTLITILTHSSGQYISSEFVMVDAVLMGGGGKNPAQVLGSAVTYQRRYSYAAIIGLAQTDDDASMLTPQAPQQRQAPQQKPVDTAEKLKSFTSAVSSAKTVQELDKFMQGANKLFKGPELAKAREVYQLKLNEIKG